MLITTAIAAPGFVPIWLRDGAARAPAEALKQLVALAARAPNQALAAPVQVFSALTSLPQKQFVPAIVVLASMPRCWTLKGPQKGAGLHRSGQ